ncbi:unnamed protein product [Durusdinium trenchii]|uniref:Uncharacterized protein n=2 Tax=Durusdinium trenchii TaxID=1381693 RepID=A0ABP0JN21_9DINO
MSRRRCSLLVALSVARMALSVRPGRDEEAVSRSEQNETRASSWCWNCCATAQCSGKEYKNRFNQKIAIGECKPIPGKVLNEKQEVVTPAMTEYLQYRVNDGDYLCAEECRVKPAGMSGYPDKVYRTGGVTEGVRCTYEGDLRLKRTYRPSGPTLGQQVARDKARKAATQKKKKSGWFG